MAALARRTAAVDTSEPFFANFTISPASIRSSIASAASISIAAGRTKFVPSASASLAARITSGWAWPRMTARSPEPYSMYSFPSTSQTWTPEPALDDGAMPSGYWSSPLAYVWAPPGISACSRSLSSTERSRSVMSERYLSGPHLRD